MGRDVETAKGRDISEEKSSMRPRCSSVERNGTARADNDDHPVNKGVEIGSDDWDA
jgi:hypothetical protein